MCENVFLMQFATQIFHSIWLTYQQVRWITHLLKIGKSAFYMTVYTFLQFLHFSVWIMDGFPHM